MATWSPEGPGVLPDRHGLLAREHVLGVRLVGVLTGESGQSSPACSRRLQGLLDAQSQRVVRRQNDVDLLAAAVERVQPVVHLGLSLLRAPAVDADALPVVGAGSAPCLTG